MKNGPIYVAAEKLVKTGYYTNLVELIKHVFALLCTKLDKKMDVIWAKSLAIDIYIFLKWLVVSILWFKSSDSLVGLLIACYLLWSNVFTYFYYHVWDNRQSNSISWQRRRFVSLFQSIAFNVFGFAYLFRFFGFNDFKWELSVESTLFGKDVLSILYSSLNLFGSGSTIASPLNLNGVILLTIQIIITFIFLTLILTNTQINKEEK